MTKITPKGQFLQKTRIVKIYYIMKFLHCEKIWIIKGCYVLQFQFKINRQMMFDFKHSTRYLEGQIKVFENFITSKIFQDLEKVYIDELRTNATINDKRQELTNALENYKRDYVIDRV